MLKSTEKQSKAFSIHGLPCIWIWHNQIVLGGVRTCLLNDAACYSGHHLASADASGRRVLDVMVANE